MKTSVEAALCEVCGGEDFSFCFSKKDKFGISSEVFTVVSCKKCGLEFVNPRPGFAEIGKFYPEYYQWKEESSDVSLGFAARLEKAYRHHQLSVEIARMKKRVWRFPCKVLDIGCGTGDRLNLLRKEGCDVFGVETSRQALHAQQQFQLPVFHGKLEEAGYEDASFDIITMYNVLEHVHHPKEMLKEIKRLLKPGGILVLEIPNSQSYQAKKFKARWAAVDVPRDLYYFNIKTVTRLLQDAGLQVQETDYVTNFWHPPTLVISLFPNLDPQLIWARDAKNENTIIKRILWGMATLLLAPFPFLEGLFGKGALMTLYVSKDTCKEISC